MKKYFAVFFIVIFIFSSCAIHRKFPFICFRKECVLGQLGYYKLKALNKRTKANSTIRKKKRSRRRDKEKNKEIVTDVTIDSGRKDSLIYFKGRSPGICTETKLVIFQKTDHWDTLLVYFPDHEKNISENKKKELRDYVEKAGTESIISILIKNCHSKNILSEHEIIWLNERGRKIVKYLNSLSVPKSKINIED
jgi:hypothetical protein